MSVSIGIALTPDTGGPGVTGEGLVADAGMAMSVARKAGGGRHHLFDPAMRDTVVTRQRVEGGIRRALDEREFVVHYQPVVSLVDGLVCGLEALVRWEHPEEGLLPPGAFIAVAEDRGLILPLGAWVLEEACAVLAGLDVGPTFEMAVNLSARQLLDQDVVSLVSGVLDRTGARPDQLALELTETALIREPTSARPALEALRELGVRISLDDFGTGFSSLTHLSEFPIDIVRIDRRFVNALPGPGTDASVVEAIIGLSCTLGLDLIAEGVETAAQAAALVSMECEKAQGFLFAHPAPLSKIGPLLLGRSLLPGPA
jgi:EAL domain-containing protein (putative c-di-GMP-specific phosphodiesterase class I)